MRAKIFQIIAGIFFLIVINQNVTFSDTYTCKCEFDTDEYEAIGYFAGTCSYTMNETRKKCELRRAEDYQDVKKSLIRYDKFGDPSELRLKIFPRAISMYDNPHALMDIKPIQFFSFMMRSSYLVAPFLNDKERRIIDDLLLKMLKKHGQDMLLIFAGLHKKYREKIFKEESTMYVKKGTAKLTVDFAGDKILICTKILPKIEE